MPLAERAGAAIMTVYDAGFDVQRKEEQFTADLGGPGIAASHPGRLAAPHARHPDSVRGIRRTRLGRSVKTGRELWVVDPLDGTREFVKRNGEFTVNIALVVDHEPLLGIVTAPAKGLGYWGAVGIGAFSHHRDAPSCHQYSRRPRRRCG